MAKRVSIFGCVVILSCLATLTEEMDAKEKLEMKDKVIEMFQHAYNSYMQYAYPADELMPLSCKGRVRGVEPSRGDMDDVLGNYSLTLIDTLDSLAILGFFDEFDHAVKLVIENVQFDADFTISVFEANIRVLGGLLGAHTVALELRDTGKAMLWYTHELLDKAVQIGYKLLPAFNTTTGIPYARINLRYGIENITRGSKENMTCTACAGTLILEMAALSRLSGIPVFEEKVRVVMDYLWSKRHRAYDLVGTTINIHTGDWVRKDSGVGAGIDSYYEYVLKTYILLGDEHYLERFNKHYAAISRYINKGPLLLNVHMHKPTVRSRNFMDSLLAFWPGLQVLKGDIKSAIMIHEILYQVVQRHNFIPEAFTTDFHVHWGQHPLRPEFAESTYFLYKATHDPYYLTVGKIIVENLEQLARVKCGFAALADVRTLALEDRMDSFFLAETFKYLYLLFTEPSELHIDIDNYVFTTEAHLLPLNLGNTHPTRLEVKLANITFSSSSYNEDDYHCPNTHSLSSGLTNYAQTIREPLKNVVFGRPVELPLSRGVTARTSGRPVLRASDFAVDNKDHVALLGAMGITVMTLDDGRVQLMHTETDAVNGDEARRGYQFMQEMMELVQQPQKHDIQSRIIQVISWPYHGSLTLTASPAQFGPDLQLSDPVIGGVVMGEPGNGCSTVTNGDVVRDKIAIFRRGDCLFVDKTRSAQDAGAIGVLIVDNVQGSSAETTSIFAMSGEGTDDDIDIPALFMFWREGKILEELLKKHKSLTVLMALEIQSTSDILNRYYSTSAHIPDVITDDNTCSPPQFRTNSERPARSHPDPVPQSKPGEKYPGKSTATSQPVDQCLNQKNPDIPAERESPNSEDSTDL